ncbi:MAG: hypothetical protein ACLQU1_16565 [Bryobacteraceae bacterium]
MRIATLFLFLSGALLMPAQEPAKMKQRVVRRGNGPSQAGLTSTGRLQRQVPCQLKQILGVCHRSHPRFVLAFSLFGRAAVTEVMEDAPFFEGPEALLNGLFDLVGGLPQLVSLAGSSGKDDSEEDRLVSSPIVPKGVVQTDDIGAKRRHDFSDSLVELCVVCERSGHLHDLIIAHPEGASAAPSR